MEINDYCNAQKQLEGICVVIDGIDDDDDGEERSKESEFLRSLYVKTFLDFHEQDSAGGSQREISVK